MNTAQQVRVWVGVGVGVLLALSCIGMAASLTSVSNFNGSGNTALFTTNDGAFAAWFVLAIICLVAEAILAGFTIYRMYKPLPRPGPVPADALASQWSASAGSMASRASAAGQCLVRRMFRRHSAVARIANSGDRRQVTQGPWGTRLPKSDPS